MKKTIALFVTALLLVTCLVGCGNKKAENTLTVATSPDFAPFEYLSDDNSVIGIEVDIMQKIADSLGMELVLEQMDFDSVLPGVQAGKYDVGMSGITITEKRKENALFTDAYYSAAQAIVVLTDSAVTCKADLEGKAVSVQTGTTAEDYCMENGYNVQAFAANSDAELALVSGKVEAWVIDKATAVAMVAQYNADNGEALTVLSEAMTEEPYAFAFSLDNKELAEKVNTALKALLADGTVEAIFESYGEPYIAPAA